jgi:Holliday junction DNA helicase RuvB
MRDEGLLGSTVDPDDELLDVSLRPRTLDEFVGQEKIKERLRISLDAARALSKPLDHLLLSGPPGLGKTSLAWIVAHELGAGIAKTSGPALERPGDLAAILTNLQPGDVFFIDEIHRVPRPVEEVLYPALEDFELDIVLGKGPAASSIRLDLPPFTLVGATTRIGTVSAPLRDRFGLVERIDYYSAAELERIVIRAAGILGADIDEGGARAIARVHDYAVARGDGIVRTDIADVALAVHEIDDLGLDKVDRAILDAIVRRFSGGPVGLGTLAIAIGEEPETVEDAYEPFLLQLGLIQRTPRGRIATPGAYRHLGVEPPTTGQPTFDL